MKRSYKIYPLLLLIVFTLGGCDVWEAIKGEDEDPDPTRHQFVAELEFVDKIPEQTAPDVKYDNTVHQAEKENVEPVILLNITEYLEDKTNRDPATIEGKYLARIEPVGGREYKLIEIIVIG